jgi:hypothetical protein
MKKIIIFLCFFSVFSFASEEKVYSCGYFDYTFIGVDNFPVSAFCEESTGKLLYKWSTATYYYSRGSQEVFNYSDDAYLGTASYISVSDNYYRSLGLTSSEGVFLSALAGLFCSLTFLMFLYTFVIRFK